MADATELFSYGGPIAVILGVAGFSVKAYFDWKANKNATAHAATEGTKTVAETDSVVVQASKEVLGMIRQELTIAAATNAQLRKERDLAEARVDQLEALLREKNIPVPPVSNTAQTGATQ